MNSASPIKELNFSTLPNAAQLQQSLGDQPEWLLITIGETHPFKIPEISLKYDALATLIPVNDAIHEVDAAGLALRLVDRSTLGYLGFPQLVRNQVLGHAIAVAPKAVAVNPALEILRHGGIVLPL